MLYTLLLHVNMFAIDVSVNVCICCSDSCSTCYIFIDSVHILFVYALWEDVCRKRAFCLQFLNMGVGKETNEWGNGWVGISWGR